MLRSTRTLALTLILMLLAGFVPALFGQETPAEDSGFRNQLIFGGAAVIIMILYIMRRKKRSSK